MKAAATVLLCMVLAPTGATGQVLVEAVDPAGVATEAGLQPDDELIAWERRRGTVVAARGAFRRPFDVREFEIEQLARGPALVTIRRGAVTSTIRVKSAYWGLDPALILPDPELDRRFKEGLAHARARRVQPALDVWRPLALELRARRQSRSAVWLECRMARLMIDPLWVGADDSGDWQQGKGVNDAQALIAGAAALARRLNDPTLEGMVWEAGAQPWQMDFRWGQGGGRMSFGRVRPLFANALAVRERAVPGSLLVAASARSLAHVWTAVDDQAVPPDYRKARDYARMAVAITSRLVPGSYADATAKFAYARVVSWGAARHRASVREFELAARYLRDAVNVGLEIVSPRERPEFAYNVAFTLGAFNLSNDAARCYKVALDTWDPKLPSVAPLDYWGPNSRSLLLVNYGSVLANLGRFDEAEQLFEQALPLAEDPVERRLALENLAGVAASRGDRVRQRQLLLDVLDIDDGRQEAGTVDPENLIGMGESALASGNSAGAAVFMRAALVALDQALSRTPVGLDEANRVTIAQAEPVRRKQNRAMACQALMSLATTGETTVNESARLDRECIPADESSSYELARYSRAMLALGEARRAAELASAAVRVARQKRLTAWRGELAFALLHLGKARCAASESTTGLAALDEARREYERMSSRAPEYIETLAAIGMCAGKAGQPQAAIGHLQRAIQLAEAMPDSRRRSTLATSFRTAQWWEAYSALSAALVDLGRVSEAFEALERGRAQAFTLTRADRTRPPDQLTEPLLRQQRALWFEYDRAQKGLEGGDRAALSRLHLAAARLDAFESRMRLMRETQAAGTTEALRQLSTALGRSTVLLEYSVGSSASRVFVVEPLKPVRAVPLHAGAARLFADVAAFRAAVAKEEQDGPESDVRVRGRDLYSTLIAPIEGVIDRYERAVIVADGPLHDLPFGALTRTDGRSYLVAWRPVHVAPSAAVYARMTQAPRRPAGGDLVAVGGALARARAGSVARTRAEGLDVLSPGDDDETTEEPDAASAGQRGPGDGALPGSRREVAAIAEVMGPEVTVLVDGEAQESRVRQLAPRARILHFATHAVVNNAVPLNGGLRLSPPPAGSPHDGFLQAWEVIEQLPMTADLVTLSACDSAYGRRIAGEGLMSLARAFHLAGARSVVSTLWTIDDRATVELMRAFYRGLREGLAKDEALRRAQTRFMTAPGQDRWRAPKYWAAFQLSGDWR